MSFVTDRSERWAPGAELFIAGRSLIVQRARAHKGRQLVRFEGVVGRDAADELKGAVLMARPLDDPTALWVHELVGAQVEEVDGTPRGVVVAVLENPASDLLELDSGALVPLTFVVDFAAPGPVRVDTPVGLFDLDHT